MATVSHDLRNPLSVAMTNVAFLGEADLPERRVEQVAGIIAGEGPARPVGALHAGRESRFT